MGLIIYTARGSRYKLAAAAWVRMLVMRCSVTVSARPSTCTSLTYDHVSRARVPRYKVYIFVLNGFDVKSCSALRRANGLSAPPAALLIALPIVGIVVTTSPSFSLYSVVVFPAASKPARTRDIYV